MFAELESPVSAGELFTWVDDLDRYPSWLGIVTRTAPAAAGPDDRGPAWEVDLRARLGPLSRAKRLRMVRTEHVPVQRVRFERHETDGRDHGQWVLTVEISRRGAASHLRMHLHYGGRFWGPVLEHVLADEIDRSRDRLLRLVSERPGV